MLFDVRFFFFAKYLTCDCLLTFNVYNFLRLTKHDGIDDIPRKHKVIVIKNGEIC